MKISVASLIALLTLLAGASLAGAGHGWMAGAVGCLALSPVSFLACINVFRPKPSRRVAGAALACGLAVCVLVVVLTKAERAEYPSHPIRVQGIAAAIAVSLALVGWLLPSILGFLRIHWITKGIAPYETPFLARLRIGENCLFVLFIMAWLICAVLASTGIKEAASFLALGAIMMLALPAFLAGLLYWMLATPRQARYLMGLFRAFREKRSVR